jgi:hypothetical protein
MKSLLCLLAALACCLLVSTCGTGRMIASDYKDDIVFIDVLPDSGVSGEAVTFTPVFVENSGFAGDSDGDVETEENYIFVWDFGGGAEPNKVYAKTASVKLRDGIRAPYVGNLKVLEVDGGEQETVYDVAFNFDVTGLSVLAVSPTRIIQGGEATFSAIIGSGVVTTYAWDFGGAGTPGGSNLPNPTIEATGQPGLYQGSLIISNEFEVFEFPFDLIVDAAPEE